MMAGESSTLHSDHDQGSRSQSPTITTRLLTVDEIPAWMRDNDFLRTGYRRPQPSLSKCLRTSLLTLTNDSVNIYTHLIGFALLLPTAVALLRHATSLSSYLPLPTCTVDTLAATHAAITSASLTWLRSNGLQRLCDPHVSASDVLTPAYAPLADLLSSHRRAMLPFLFSALACLAFSTVYHIFCIRSTAAMTALVKLDYLGIALLCAGHAFTGVYYLFYCRRHIARAYYPFIALALLLTVPAVLSDAFASTAARTWRTLVFGSLGSIAIFPVLHACYYVADRADWLAIVCAVITMVMYAVGGSIYAMRFPECCRVGHHDRFLASHQLMHMAVLIAIAIQVSITYYLFTVRIQHGCAATPPYI